VEVKTNFLEKSLDQKKAKNFLEKTNEVANQKAKANEATSFLEKSLDQKKAKAKAKANEATQKKAKANEATNENN
jgi:hypothetical protein